MRSASLVPLVCKVMVLPEEAGLEVVRQMLHAYPDVEKNIMWPSAGVPRVPELDAAVFIIRLLGRVSDDGSWSGSRLLASSDHLA